MTWKTHVAIGTNAIWLTALTGTIDQSILLLLPSAAFASLLPDIDTTGFGAKIHYLKGPGRIFAPLRGVFVGRYFHHRGLMHSLFVTLIIFFILTVFFKAVYPLLPAVFALSYLSHPIIDGFNHTVGYLYPFSLKRFALLPRFLRTPVGGLADNLMLFFGVIGLLLYFFLFQNVFIP